MRARGWWRRNARWTFALPVALVLAVAGNAHRVETYWWDNGYHQEVAAADRGEWLDVAYPYTDPYGPATRAFSVRLIGLQKTDQVDVKYADPASPAGMQAYLVELAFRAEPDVPMKYCLVAVLDEDGNRYGGDQDVVDTGSGCVPNDNQGPDVPFSRDQRRGVVVPGFERPRSWTVEVPVLVREDARPEEVRLMWQWNDYVTLRLRD